MKRPDGMKINVNRIIVGVDNNWKIEYGPSWIVRATVPLETGTLHCPLATRSTWREAFDLALDYLEALRRNRCRG